MHISTKMDIHHIESLVHTQKWKSKQHIQQNSVAQLGHWATTLSYHLWLFLPFSIFCPFTHKAVNVHLMVNPLYKAYITCLEIRGTWLSLVLQSELRSAYLHIWSSTARWGRVYHFACSIWCPTAPAHMIQIKHLVSHCPCPFCI